MMTDLFRIRLLPVLAGLLLFAFSGVAPAQEGGSTPPPSDKAVETLLEVLKDDAARQALIEKLEAAQGKAAEDPSGIEAVRSGFSEILGTVSGTVERFSGQLAQSADLVMRLPGITTDFMQRMAAEENREFWFSLLVMVGAVLAAALVAEWLVVRLLARPLRIMEAREAESSWFRAIYVAGRLFLKIPPVLAFAGAAFGVLSSFNPDPVPRLILLTVINANLFVRIGTVFGLILLSPKVRNLRLLPISDETSTYLQIWLRRFLVTILYGYFAIEAAHLLGLPAGAHELLLKLLGFLVLTMAVVFILQNRDQVADAIRGDAEGGTAVLRGRIAASWHIFAILYAIAGFFVWSLEIRDGFTFLARATVVTIVIGIAARLLRAGLARFTDRLFNLNDETKARFPLLEARANRYIPAIDRIGGAVIFLLAVLPILQAWGLDVFGWLASDTGRGFTGRIASIVFTLTVALVVWETVSMLIERFLRNKSGEADSQRLLTLLPLIRNFVRVALAVFATLIVLSELGIDIAPLLAGAGVVGLAIGFGAQTLVKDVITGIFMLVEDSIAVGDWVRISDQLGRIESMSIRTVRIRDIDGQVHSIPFGEITMVTNLNREFGIALMDIGVAYREDYDEVVAVLERVGKELYEDPDWNYDILSPLEVMGLQNLADSAVEIRVRYRTRPVMQWKIRREFLRRVKKAFDQEGIEIPFPHQTIYFGEDKKGNAPPLHLKRASGEERGKAEDARSEAKTGNDGKPEAESSGGDAS
jgi:small conductance mechanosensitive channel